LVAVAPLAWGLYKHPDLLATWLGLPSAMPSLIEVAKNIAAVPYHLVVANNAPAENWLGRAPLLDAFSAVAFAVGGYLLLRKIRLLRAPLWITILLLGVVLVGLNGPVSVGVLLPFMYVLVAAGVGYLLDQWLTVFPRNPIAKSLGISVLSIVIGLVCWFNIQHYFIGWPHARATHEVFSLHDQR
jgi:hypothetical protein